MQDQVVIENCIRCHIYITFYNLPDILIMEYLFKEYADIHLMYGTVSSNSTEARGCMW